MDKSNNGWFPISTVPKRKGVDGKPFKFLVTRVPFSGIPPLHVVWWGNAPGGRTLVIRGNTPLRYEPTHWREFPEFPSAE